MTTARQVKRLLAPLLARNEDLADFKTHVVLKPVRHVIRAVWVMQTSNADRPDFEWSLACAFNPRGNKKSIWFCPFYTPKGIDKSWSDARMPDGFLSTVEDRVLPMLRPVQTLEDLFTFEGANHEHYLRTLEHGVIRTYMDAAFGRFDAALETCRKVSTWSRDGADYRWYGFDLLVDEMLPALESGDRDDVIALLHRWEAAVVERMGLGAIYESTPFPLELLPG